MSDTPTSANPEAKPEQDLVLTQFANRLLGDYDHAMDRFYEAVERRMLGASLTPAQVRRALDLGYGMEVAEGWEEWIADADDES